MTNIAAFFSVEKISITKELKDVVVKELNVSATFECEFSKVGLKVEWTKGEKTIKASDKYEITSDEVTYRLVINDCTAEDVAEYKASFQNLTTSAKLKMQGNCTY